MSTTHSAPDNRTSRVIRRDVGKMIPGSTRAHRIAAVVLAAVAVILAGAGCGPSSAGSGNTAAKAEASKLAADPHVKADEAQAKAIFQGCAATGSWVTKGGRHKIWVCAFPPAGKFPPGFEACAETAITRNAFSKAGRVKLADQLLPTCFLEARKAAAK